MRSLVDLKINVYDEDSDSYMPENIVDIVNRIFNLNLTEDFFYNIKDRDIVSQAMAHQWMELFEEMTMQQRDLYINQIRGEYER